MMAKGSFEPIEKPVRVVDRPAVLSVERRWCEYCGAYGRPVHAHHEKSRGAGGHDEPSNLIALCYVCHDLRHRGQISRRQILIKLIELGRITSEAVGLNG